MAVILPNIGPIFSVKEDRKTENRRRAERYQTRAGIPNTGKAEEFEPGGSSADA